jgi:hypothetical protein
MIGTLTQAVVAFILTGIIGGRIAQIWQARAAREARFFEASKDMYSQMVCAADDLSALVGKRLYASQRVCMIAPSDAGFDDAVASYRSIVIDWNQQLLSLELAVRTRFRDTSLYEFELLQSKLALISSGINSFIKYDRHQGAPELLRQLRDIRAEFFQFTQRMMKEARLLHRQMHFGVVVQYDKYQIEKMSTQNLIKALFTSQIEGQAVVRSPSDFGLPVSVRDARLGIYE